MRASLLALATLTACGGPAATTAHAPSVNATAPEPPPPSSDEVSWMDRTYELFARKVSFKGGRYADSEQELELAPPTYLDVNGDGVKDALLPLKIGEAATAAEQGNPTFHTFLVFIKVDGELVHRGELPTMVCGPLRAELEGEWLHVTPTRSATPGGMCSAASDGERYRWNGTWFESADGDEVEPRLD
jgi:hypothetical protein